MDKNQDYNNAIKLIRSDEENRVDVFIGEEAFASYLYSDALKKPVLYPMKTASGTIITRDFLLIPDLESGQTIPIMWVYGSTAAM